MISRKEYDEAQARALNYFRWAGIVLTGRGKEERRGGRLRAGRPGPYRPGSPGLREHGPGLRQGAGAVPGTDLPRAPAPHPRRGPGKEETFRCRWGKVYLYVPGTPGTPRTQGLEPHRQHLTAAHARSSSTPGTSTRCSRTPCTGSGQGPRGRWSPSFPPPAPTARTCSPTHASAASPGSASRAWRTPWRCRNPRSPFSPSPTPARRASPRRPWSGSCETSSRSWPASCRRRASR